MRVCRLVASVTVETPTTDMARRMKLTAVLRAGETRTRIVVAIGETLSSLSSDWFIM